MIIIATRFHYTVDVFYGAMIAFTMFNIYHFALEYIRDLLERGSNFERESTSLRLFANFGKKKTNSFLILTFIQKLFGKNVGVI